MKNRTLVLAVCLLMFSVCTQVGRAKPAPTPNSVKVTVIPYGTYAQLSIDLAQGAIAVLQIGKWAPIVDSGLHKENVPDLFPKGATVFTKILSERNDAGGFKSHYDLNTLLPNGAGALKQDTHYYYALQVIEPGGKRIETGDFKTKFRMAELYINEIHVTNDSDSTGSGELSFHFFINKQLAYKLPNDAPEYKNLSSGQSLKFGREFKIKLNNTAINDSAMLWVVGFDDDESCPFSLCVCGKGTITDLSTVSLTGENKCGEWTTVGKKLFYGDPNATGLKESFEKLLFINAVDGNGSELKYEVYATLRVFYM